jgi:IS605 OrfB family transposase
MLRTVSIKLVLTKEEASLLALLKKEYVVACNSIVPEVVKNRCWNRVALHKLVYNLLRSTTQLGSQMACNAIFSVCKAYQAQKELGRIQKDTPVPQIIFGKGSVHFDKRTYSLTQSGKLSLYTLDRRIKVAFTIGDHQRRLLEQGVPKEAELIHRKGYWYFNLVVELPAVTKQETGEVIGVDVGENNIAAINTGKIYGGQKLREDRNRYLAQRRRLQSNGTQSAKQLLCKVSGRESRHVEHVNHQISKDIVEDAKKVGASVIVLEDLTNIRENIRAERRIRSRLHRWPFRQLQSFIAYKAEAIGITVRYEAPAYTSVTCSNCLSMGERKKHQFKCSNCGLLAHADCNASRNLARIVKSADFTRARVNWPNVDTICVP